MDERYRIVLPARVAAQLQVIFDYIAKDSPQNASAMVDRLFTAIDGVKRFPHRQEVGGKGKRTHSLPVDSYVIFFEVLEKDGVVEVLEVRHGARRQPKRFRR